MPEVQVEELGSLTLVGLILREIINQNLQKPKMAEKVKRMNVVMEVRASKMVVTLRVQRGVVSLENGSAPDVQVRVRGSMNDFLQLGLLRVPWDGLLQRRFWASGRLDKLPQVLPLLIV